MAPAIEVNVVLQFIAADTGNHPDSCSCATKVRAANRIPDVRGGINPRLTLSRRNVSVVDVILNRINKIGQLLTCRTRVPASKSIFGGIPFSDQALLLRAVERRTVDACLQVLDRLEHTLHRYHETAGGRIP